MSFQVDIGKTVRSARRSFELRVRFDTTARRTVIFGPSGAGKTLTLQAIAGLVTPDCGRIAFDGELLFDSDAGTDRPARDRGFGYLFQDYALFPRLNVRQNIAFGLARGWRNPPARGDNAAVDHWLQAFELTEVANQRPDELSGGQRQRTALARALVAEPSALLLDEPFAALDPALRVTMRAELDQLQRRLGVPMILITHDPDDARLLGEHVLTLRDGRRDCSWSSAGTAPDRQSAAST